MGAKKLLHLFGFSTTSTLNGKYLLKETWHRQSVKGTGKYELSRTLPKKFYELLSTNGLKRQRLFIHPHYFVPSQSTALTWLLTATPNETALDLSVAQIQSLTRC